MYPSNAFPPSGALEAVVDRALSIGGPSLKLSPFVYGYDRDSIDDGESGDDSGETSPRTDDGRADESHQSDEEDRGAIEAAE